MFFRLLKYICSLISVVLVFTVETELQRTIKINKDGSVEDKSQLPKCFNGARINLLSYTIQQENCLSSNTNCEAQLSPAQQLYIHQQCSLKETCEDMAFPTEDGQNGIFLKVKYECLGEFEGTDITSCIQNVMVNVKKCTSRQ